MKVWWLARSSGDWWRERERKFCQGSHLGEKEMFSMTNLFLADQMVQAVTGKTNFQGM